MALGGLFHETHTFLKQRTGIADFEDSALHIGQDVPAMLKNDLALELAVVTALKEVIAHCESVRDYQTREILEAMLDDTEEDHAHWLEQQLGLIDKVGLPNYLQSQM